MIKYCEEQESTCNNNNNNNNNNKKGDNNQPSKNKGTISRLVLASGEQFEREINEIAYRSCRVETPAWTVVHRKPLSFLVKKGVRRPAPFCQLVATAGSLNNHQQQQQHFHLYEFHIVYSVPFQVPCLFFSGQCDGTADDVTTTVLGAEDFLLSAATGNAFDFEDNRNSSATMPTFTQQDHPVLAVPFWSIHPCKTSNVMGTLHCQGGRRSVSSSNFTLSWLSLFGPKLGLTVPLSLIRLQSHEEGGE